MTRIHAMTSKHVRAHFAALVMSAFLAACGNLTAGGFGEAQVYGSGDADESPAPVPPPAPAPSYAGAAGPLPAGAGLVEGSLQARLDLALIDDDGSVIALTSGVIDAQLDLDGSQTPLLVERLVPAARYSAIRVRFSEVSATVLSGLVIGGIPYVGPVTVDIGASPFEVQIPVAFELARGGEVRLLLDLNSDAWLLALNVLTQVVTAVDFGASIDVTVR
jgi:hypothetical protein